MLEEYNQTTWGIEIERKKRIREVGFSPFRSPYPTLEIEIFTSHGLKGGDFWDNPTVEKMRLIQPRIPLIDLVTEDQEDELGWKLSAEISEEPIVEAE